MTWSAGPRPSGPAAARDGAREQRRDADGAGQAGDAARGVQPGRAVERREHGERGEEARQRAAPAAAVASPGYRSPDAHDRPGAFWQLAPGQGALRTAPLSAPGPGDVLVRAVRSGISRGTELLVWRGGVPERQHAAMRAPFQEGDFPGPLKYGYLSVGVVEHGPAALVGRSVFCLHPHQTAYVVPATAVHPLPDGVPAARAVLAGTVETAVNALWDAAPLVGDRVLVIGAGMVGCALAALLGRIPGVECTLVDVDPARAATAAALGVAFAQPADAPGDRDLVFHASATSAGLQRALDLLAPEGRVIELSWYGDAPVSVELGGAFHAGRLAVVASQVGRVAPARRGTRSTDDRLALALELLRDPLFDALITGSSPFEELPDVMARLAAGTLPALCHTITYDEG